MAGRLNPGRHRAGVLAGLVAAVLLVHAWVTQVVAERMADLGAGAAMPPRFEVTYVADMAPTTPPPMPPPALAPPPVPPLALAPATARRAAPAASAAEAAREPPASDAPPRQETVLVTPPDPSPADALAERAPDPAPQPVPPLAATSAVASASAPEAAASAFAWPSSTRLRYVLTGNYRGEINGQAQVEWVRQGERYQTHVDISVGLPFAPLLTRRMSSEGRLTPQGLQPERYDEDSKVAFRDRRRFTMRFEPDAVQMPDGRRIENTLAQWPAVQDTASQFVQMTWMFTTRPELLVPGGTVELALALPRNIDRWVYDVLEPETLHTPFGAVETFHLRPRRVARAGSDLTAEVWFAPSYRYLPVRIRIRQDADTFIDLMVDRPPQLAE